jgi:hypothetical protein
MMTIKTDGKVGIGTTAPIAKLHVSNAGAEGFEVNPTGGTVYLTGYNRSGGAYAPVALTGAGGVTLTLGSGGASFNSNVGIGTASPGLSDQWLATAETLSVIGSSLAGSVEVGHSEITNNVIFGALKFVNPDNSDASQATNRFVAGMYSRCVTSDSNAGDDSGGSLHFTVKPESSTMIDAIAILSDGKVGIGTTAPSSLLHVSSTTANALGIAFIHQNIATNNPTLLVEQSGSGGNANVDQGLVVKVIGTTDGSGNTLHVYQRDNSTTGLVVKGSGKVGIGTNAPFSQFHIKDATDANFTVSCGVASETRLISINDGDNDYKAMKFYGSRFEFLTGNVGIGSASPAAPLDVPRASDYKVIKLGDDITSHYVMTGNADHTLTLTCGSYFQAEIVITANQTNGGTYNNLYIRGIWSNNHTSHHWDEIENVGSLGTSTFTITNGQNGATTNSGEWKIVHDYTSGSFAGMTVRITDFYGTHAYTIS